MTARSILVLAGALLLPAPAPAAEAPSRTFVIVHGAWGGGWAWRRVDRLLRAHGHDIYRPTLTGQGERVHLASPEIGLATHVEDVVNVIRFEDLHDVILVGHSYGGMVITGVAEKVPERIRRLVYVDAFLPEDGESLVTAGPGRAERSAWLQSTIKDGFSVPPWVKPDQAPPRDVPHPARTLTDPISLKNRAARELPATYILTVDPGKQQDDFDPFAERARARGWPVLRLSADHNAQWSAPDALVEMLNGLP